MDNQSSISYADDWKNADNFVYYKPGEQEIEPPSEEKKTRKKGSKPLLLIIQIIVCLLITAAAYGLKTFGGDYYREIRKAYYNAVNDEIILTKNFEDFDLNKLFNEIKD